MTKITVINSRQDGYRRGGIELKRGKNELDSVDEKTLQALQADPCLTVTIIGETNVTPNNENPNQTDSQTNGASNQTNPSNGESIDNPPIIPPVVNPVIPASDSDPKKPPKTRAELLLNLALEALTAEDNSAYYNKDGSPSVSKWRKLLNDESVTKEEIDAALEAAQKTE